MYELVIKSLWLYYLYLAGFGINESLNFKEHNSKFKLGKIVIFIVFRTVKMSEPKKEIRYILKFYFKEGKNATQAAKKICDVYEPSAVSVRVAQIWFKEILMSKMYVTLVTLLGIKWMPFFKKWIKIDLSVVTT